MEPYFIWEIYLKLNQELSNFGIDNQQNLLLHWIRLGKYENKVSYDINNIYFDWIYYLKTNNLNFNTELEAWKHFSTKGKFNNLRYYNPLESNFPTIEFEDQKILDSLDINDKLKFNKKMFIEAYKEFINLDITLDIKIWIKSWGLDIENYRYFPDDNINEYHNYNNKLVLTPAVVDKLNKQPNRITINKEIYKYLYNQDFVNVYKDIYNNGILKGYIYSLKQLSNYYDTEIKLYKIDSRFYIEKNDDILELSSLVKEIESKSFLDMITEIKIINNSIREITNELVCCFIGDLDRGKLLIDKIKKSDKINLTTIFIFRNINDYQFLLNDIKDFNSIVFKSKEYGNDIIPTLQALFYLNFNLKYKFEYIYKFHTKSDLEWFNKCTDYLIDTSTDLLKKELENIDSNCITPQKYSLPIKQDNFPCKILFKEYFDQINMSYKFSAGSIFFCKNELILKILEFIESNNYKSYFLNNCYDTNIISLNNSSVHFLERLFGCININITKNQKIKYEITRDNKKIGFLNNKLWAHLHCYNIDEFDKIYGEYIANISKKFSVIITYCIGNIIPKLDITFIEVSTFNFDLCQNLIEKVKKYHNFIIGYENKILCIDKNIHFTPDILNLFSEFKKSENDVLSPIVLFKNELVYFGGINEYNHKYYINNNVIDLKKYNNKSIFYKKKTDMFFEDIFICKIEHFSSLFGNCCNSNLKKYSIGVSPFVKSNIKYHKTKYKFMSNDFSYNDLDLELYNFNSKFYLKNRNIMNIKNNVLIIEHSILTPDKDCGSKYIYNFIKTLLKLKYNVYFFQCNFNNNKDYMSYIYDLQSMGVYVNIANCNWEFNKIELLLKANFNLFNYIFVSRYDKITEYYDIIKKYNSKAKICYQTHDLNFLRKERENEILNLCNKNNLIDKNNELDFINKCDITILVSQHEYDLLHNNYNINKNKLFNYPIFFESNERINNYSPHCDDIIFIGSLHKPNIDSIIHFLENYFKEITIKIPNIVLNVIGSCCDSVRKFEKIYGKNLKLLGYISHEKLREIFSKIKLSITPLIYGAGIKGKILDSFNYSVPVITSSIGAEGIKCVNEEDIIILDYENDYVNKFVNYYNDNNLLIKISDRSKNTFDKCYSNDNSIKYCQKLFKSVNLNKTEINIKKKKIVILFQQYNNNIYKDFYKFIISLCGEYHYDMVVVNNNRNKILNSKNINIKIINGDNSNNEMSGYQVGINYLLNNDLYKKYDYCIISNDTINYRPPITFINNINYDSFTNIINNNYISGVVDSFGEPCNLNDLKFDYWIRSNLIIFPMKFIVNIKKVNVYTKDNLNFNINDILKKKLNNWLSNEYYKNVDRKAKLSRIFNEYTLTHNLIKGYDKKIINLYNI